MTETVEVVPGRFFWQCTRNLPPDTADCHYFSTDDALVYDPYYSDFGPLNIAQVCRYCRILNQKMNDPGTKHKQIYHCCRPQNDTRANSVLLVSAWSLLFNKCTQEEAMVPFKNLKPSLLPYRDASLGPSCFHLTVPMCVRGLANGVALGWLDPETFDTKAYEHYERVENGDFNWVLPGKFLAFSGPTQTPIAYVDGVKTNTPETYFDYFAKNNVTGVVRFNNKVYDRKKFLDAGLNHYDMYFPDGGNPTDAIIKRFIEVAESEPGSLAVHCKAGLGRTGTLISLYIMKHYKITAADCISWLRLCRPGSVIGPQQIFLQEMEKRMWREGDLMRKNAGASGDACQVDSAMKSLSVGAAGSGTGACNCGNKPAASGTSPSPMRPKGGFSIGGVSVGRTSAGSPASSPTRSPSLRAKAGSLLKR